MQQPLEYFFCILFMFDNDMISGCANVIAQDGLELGIDRIEGLTLLCSKINLDTCVYLRTFHSPAMSDPSRRIFPDAFNFAICFLF